MCQSICPGHSDVQSRYGQEAKFLSAMLWPLTHVAGESKAGEACQALSHDYLTADLYGDRPHEDLAAAEPRYLAEVLACA